MHIYVYMYRYIYMCAHARVFGLFLKQAVVSPLFSHSSLNHWQNGHQCK